MPEGRCLAIAPTGRKNGHSMAEAPTGWEVSLFAMGRG